jgi:hypothetical protein
MKFYEIVTVIISQRAHLAAWNYLHDNFAFHSAFNYILTWSIQRSTIDFVLIRQWLHASEFMSEDRGRSSGFLEVILFPLKMIQPRCSLFECLLKYSLTQHTYSFSRLLVSALLTNHNQTFFYEESRMTFLPYSKIKFTGPSW